MKREIELYIHIPFCVKKCAYCDFLSSPADEAVKKAYVKALELEIAFWGQKLENTTVSTIFIGGGTPSLLSGEQMETLLLCVRRSFRVEKDAEITMEMNPGTVNDKNLIRYKKAGVNRISIGLQSAKNEELQKLGRIHTFQEFLDTYKAVRACGFENVNVDLISAIPGQTRESFEESLHIVACLEPEHISAYSLIVEEGTPFYEKYGDGKPKERDLPSEEEERAMYKRTKEILEKYGYERYEISNYAKDGFACRHNIGYWERKEYIGVGIGAASFLGKERFSNIRKIDQYLAYAKERSFEKMVSEREILDMSQEMEEFMFLGLRMQKGISAAKFQETFGCPLDEVYGKEIAKLKKQGLLKEKGENFSLTDFGIDISNYVFVEFMNK